MYKYNIYIYIYVYIYIYMCISYQCKLVGHFAVDRNFACREGPITCSGWP